MLGEEVAKLRNYSPNWFYALEKFGRISCTTGLGITDIKVEVLLFLPSKIT